MTTATTTNRTYKATLTRIAPYPLNWDVTDQGTFETLEAAMAQAEAWMAKYPKGIATRTRWVEVWSHAGYVTRYDRQVENNRKVHLNTKRKTGR